MSFFKQKQSGFDSVIESGTVVEGTIVFAGTLVMNGVLRGTQVRADRNVEFGPKEATFIIGGSVDVEHIDVDTIEISGSVRGCKVSAGTVIVRKSGTLSMSFIRYRNLVIEPGAIVSGDLQHLDAEPTILREPSTV